MNKGTVRLSNYIIISARKQSNGIQGGKLFFECFGEALASAGDVA